MTLRGECGMFKLVPHMEDKNFQATTTIHVQDVGTLPLSFFHGVPAEGPL